MGYVNPVNFTMPSGGGFPQDFTITDPNESTLVPTAIIVLLSGSKASAGYGTRSATGRISVGFTDFSSEYVVGHAMEDATVSALANSGYQIDTASVIDLPNNAGGAGAPEVTATFVSAAAGQVTLNASIGSDFHGLALFVYDSVHVVVEQIDGSATQNASVNSSAHGQGVEPDAVFAASIGQAFSAAGGGAGGYFSFGWWARGSDTQGCLSQVMEDGAATATSVGAVLRNDRILRAIASSGGTVTEGAGIELAGTTSGFTLTTRDAAVSIPGMYVSLYLGGVDTYCGVEVITAGSTGAKSVTTPGFAARMAVLATFRTTAANTLSSGQNAMSIGAATDDLQGVVGDWSRDAQATSEADSIASDADVVMILQPTTLDWVADYTGSTASGFDINVSDAAGGNRAVLVLAIGEPRRPANGWLADLVRRRSQTVLWGPHKGR